MKTEVIEKVEDNASLAYKFIKRAFDILASAVALIILLPILLIIALVIYIDDPHGSPLFTQIRVGKNCEEFKLYKFRTMYMNAEKIIGELENENEMDGPVFKIKNDPRITRVGRVLRKTGIDELPQLLNIIKGDMSVVGPRPALPREVALYSERDKQRLMITPGLTCIWQVQPKRNTISFDEWMKMDIEYIQNRTLWLDLKLIFMTVACVLRSEGM